MFTPTFFTTYFTTYSSPVLFLVRRSGAVVSARGRRQDRRGDTKRKVEIGANLVFWTNKMEKGKKKTQRWSKKKYDGMSCFFKVTLDHIDPESGKKLGEGFVGCMPWNFKMSIPEHSDRNVMKPRHLKRWHVWEFELTVIVSAWDFGWDFVCGVSRTSRMNQRWSTSSHARN